MFDDVPVRVWLVLLIGMAAWLPARYLWQHISASPARRDITKPPVDLSWRTSRQFVRSAGALALLGALAVFIFTPQAERFARSPLMLPCLVGVFGLYGLYTVVQGWITGRIEPMSRGLGEHDRASRPKRYWASMVWNALLGAFMVWLAPVTYHDAVRSAQQTQCIDEGWASSPREQLAACNSMIAAGDLPDEDRSYWINARGIAHWRLKDDRSALADYSEAIRLAPDGHHAWHNRGLVFERMGRNEQAIADYSAALRLGPENGELHFRRGFAYGLLGKYPQTIADMDQAIRLKPDSAAAYHVRGAAYADLGQRALAEADFAKAVELEPRLAKVVPKLD